MTAPIVPICKQDSDLRALLGDNPFRFFSFGDAGENKTYPYATYQLIGGAPENFLGDRPNANTTTWQIDVWAKTELQAENVAARIMYALETSCHIIGYNGNGRDATTRNYRVSFTVDFLQRF